MKRLIIILLFVLPFLAQSQQTFKIRQRSVVKINSIGGGGGGGGGFIRDNLLMDDGFENTSTPWMNWNDLSQSAGHAWSRQQVSTIANEGTYCYRAEVRSGCDGYVSSGYRSELADALQTGGGALVDAGVMWYGLSIYFEAPTSGGLWVGSYGGHYIQWHPGNGSGSAELSLWQDGSNWDLATNPSGGAGVTEHSLGNTITSGVWHSIVFKVDWASSNGYVKCWVDGTLLWNITGLSWNNTDGRYLKLGMNRWGNCSTPSCPSGSQGPCDTWIIYYDNLRIGNSSATFNDVAPVQITPEPN